MIKKNVVSFKSHVYIEYLLVDFGFMFLSYYFCTVGQIELIVLLIRKKV